MLNNFWYAIEFSSAISHQPQFLKVLDRDLVLYRTADNQIHAMDNACIHRGASLSSGSIIQDCLVCPYHGWHYQSDGTCIKIPSNLASASISKQAKMSTYPVQEKYGWIWLFLGDKISSTQASLPEIPQFGDPQLRSIQGEFHWNANYERVLENGLDFAHAPFVHAGAFGNPNAPEVPELFIEQSNWSAQATVMLKPNPPKGLWRFLVRKTAADIKTRTGFCLPNLTFLEVNLPFGQLMIWTAHVPVDAHTTVSKWLNFRSFFTGKWADKDAYNRTIRIFEQDKPIVESQRPQIISISDGFQIHVPADALQLNYRKLRQQAAQISSPVSQDH